MSNLEKPMESETGWQRLSVPEMHQWVKGEMVAGRLLQVVTIEVKGKRVIQYVLDTMIRKDDKDGRIKFLATFDLAQKLTLAHRGMLVRIKYLGEDDTVKSKGNAMRLFDVQVKPDPNAAPDRDTGPITDDDVPF